MWGSVLGWALLASINPVFLGAALLLISRSRPVKNLFAFWIGALIVNIPAYLAPPIVLHSTPMLTSLAEDLARPATVGNSTVLPMPTGMGVLMLSIAALLTVRLRVRQRADLPASGGDTMILVRDSNRPSTVSRPLGRAQDAARDVGSAIRRLLGRAQDAWEGGSLWVAVVFGLGCFPPPPLVLVIGTTIVASGAAIGTQVSAAIAFVVVMLAVVEIALVSCLVAPAKTEAVLRPVHDWVLAHRWEVLIAILAVAGFWQLVTGVGIV